MSGRVDIAVVGAGSSAGGSLLELLESRDFPFGEVHALDIGEAVGTRVEFRNGYLSVKALDGFDFETVQLAFFLTDAGTAYEHAPRAAAAGCVVVDSSPAFRLDETVPLVIPEVNPEAVAGFRERGILSSPADTTVMMLLALEPLQHAVGIDRVDITLLHAVAGPDRRGAEELAGQTARLLNGMAVDTEVFPRQIAFNLLPQVGAFMDNGYTRGEMELVWEARRILGDPELPINPTLIQAPVFFGHAAVLCVHTREPIDAESARELLASAPGLEVIDEREPGGYPTPVTEAAGSDSVYLGRIRADLDLPRALNLWVVADNMRRCTALNCLRIGEILLDEMLLN